jgi:hypothetical protein
LSVLIVCLHFADASMAVLVMFQEGFDHAGSGVPYSGTRDTTLLGGPGSFGSGNANLGSGFIGAVNHLNSDGAIRHSLLSFDDIVGSGIGQIPSGSTVNSATLTLHVQNGGDDFTLHRMIADWSETTATYNNFQLNGNSMAGLQADDLEARIAAIFVDAPTASGVDLDIDVTSDVQAWVNGTDNFGWGFLPTGDETFNWFTSDASLTAGRPLLSVDFTPIPEASSVLCLGFLVTAVFVYAIGCKGRRRHLT